MKKWWNITSLVGIFCSSLCFLGIPLLLSLAPFLAMDWLKNDSLMRIMLVMFLVMFAIGSISAFRAHRRKIPGILALFGACLLIAASLHAVIKQAGWLGFFCLIVSWFLDLYWMRTIRHEEDKNSVSDACGRRTNFPPHESGELKSHGHD